MASRATCGGQPADVEQLLPAARRLLVPPRAAPGERERRAVRRCDRSNAPRRSAAGRQRVGVRVAAARSRSRRASRRGRGPAPPRACAPTPGPSAAAPAAAPSGRPATGDRAGCARARPRAGARRPIGRTENSAQESRSPAMSPFRRAPSTCCSSATSEQLDPRRSGLAPEPARRMQHVDVRQPRADPLEAMKQIPRLEHRRVEHLPLKLTSAPARDSSRATAASSGTLVGEPREQELPRHERAIVEPAASDQERVRSCAAAQAGRLEIEKHERRPRRCAGRHSGASALRVLQTVGEHADRLPAVASTRRPAGARRRSNRRSTLRQARSGRGLL